MLETNTTYQPNPFEQLVQFVDRPEAQHDARSIELAMKAVFSGCYEQIDASGVVDITVR